jgi:hypothetical protein
MKLFFAVSVVFIFGMLGYKNKKKYINQLNALKELKKYSIFLKDNLYLFKNNVQEINNNYIIMHKNKNANLHQYKLNNAQTMYDIIKILQNYIFDIELNGLINQYFLNLGNSEYGYEIDKLGEFISLLEREILNTEKNLKEKGDLYFKLSLAIGSVLGILIW